MLERKLVGLVVWMTVGVVSAATYDEALRAWGGAGAVFELRGADGERRMAVDPDRQARLAAWTMDGESGRSIGWVSSEKENVRMDSIAPEGAEQFLLGPEGGRYGVFFDAGKPLDQAHWRMPPLLTRARFSLLDRRSALAHFSLAGGVVNRSGRAFSLQVSRRLILLDELAVRSRMSVLLPEGVRFAGWESTHTMQNTGSQVWSAEGGQLAMRLRGTLRISSSALVAVPRVAPAGRSFRNPEQTDQADAGVRVGESITVISPARIEQERVRFMPGRHLPVMVCWDPKQRWLAVIRYDQPDGERRYVNDSWEEKASPYAGPSLILYKGEPGANDPDERPLVWESRSPALTLSPQQRAEFGQRVLTIEGTDAMLDRLCREMVGVGLADLSAAFLSSE